MATKWFVLKSLQALEGYGGTSNKTSMVQLRFQLLILQSIDSHSGEGCVMKSTVINTSKEMTAYSDYPPPGEFANFMHNTQMLRYFKMYAEHHDLVKHVKFNHCVTDVSRTKDFVKTGQWTVNYLDEYCTSVCPSHIIVKFMIF
jgi:cation diffusion facilitator CzcD-associated flavoprotein CzcO